MGIPKILIKMFAFLHLLLSLLRPISQLAVILSIHIMDVNNSIWLAPPVFRRRRGPGQVSLQAS
jgi:hypothetical protein